MVAALLSSFSFYDPFPPPVKLHLWFFAPSHLTGATSQTSFAREHCKSVCSIVSGPSPQPLHTGSPIVAFLWIASLTTSALLTHFQINTLTLCLMLNFHSVLQICLLCLLPASKLVPAYSCLLLLLDLSAKNLL